MKNFQTTRDVLDFARCFHHRLADYYQKLSDSSNEERMRMLLDYMAYHENGIEAILARYKEDASHKVLDSWFQFTEEESFSLPCEEEKIQPHLSVDRVIEHALEIDDCLIRLYRMLVECSRCDSVRDLFANLLEMVEQEKHHKIRMALGSIDL
ncbi:hypothetical protein JW992_15915 [candidate division KSB1 bacterium]|nr:hypothetical protein [candidate division KSB1 bacterium]